MKRISISLTPEDYEVIRKEAFVRRLSISKYLVTSVTNLREAPPIASNEFGVPQNISDTISKFNPVPKPGKKARK